MNNRTHGYVLAGMAVLALLPAAAMAHNYTYLEGGYLNRDTPRGSNSGLRIAGSAAIAPPVALFGEYADTGDFDQFSAGLLFHSPLNNIVDLNLGVSFEHMTVRRASDSGIGLRGGLRWQLAPQFELHPEIRHLRIFNRDSTSLRVAGLFALTPELDLQGAIQGGDDDRYEVGVRYNFGPRMTR
jgi:hypothetical protein